MSVCKFCCSKNMKIIICQECQEPTIKTGTQQKYCPICSRLIKYLRDAKARRKFNKKYG